jgi:hypothetical protein
MRARSAHPGVGFPVREIRGEAPSVKLNNKHFLSHFRQFFSRFLAVLFNKQLFSLF